MTIDSAQMWLQACCMATVATLGRPISGADTQQPAKTKLERLAVQDSRNFGNAVSAVGDVDADGTPDLLIAEPPWGGGTKTVGAAWILSGKDGHTIHRVVEGEDQTAFARAVSAAGDLDADGRADWLVASDDLQPGGIGIVEAFSGRTGARLYRWRGRSGSTEGFGLYLGSVGDVDGDGRADVLISGTPESSGEPALAVVLSGKDGRAALEIPRGHPGDYVAASACAAGDVDRDGTADIALGLFSGESRRFEVQLRSGRTGNVLRMNASMVDLGAPPMRVASMADWDGDGLPEICASGSTAAANIFGSRSGAVLLALGRSRWVELGGAVTPAGDLDGDGKPDLWRGEDATGIAMGTVSAVSGASSDVLWTSAGDEEGWTWHQGHSLAKAGDVDGDGVEDVLVGTDHSLSGHPGRAAVLSGKSGRFLMGFARGELREIVRDWDSTRSWERVEGADVRASGPLTSPPK